MSERKPASTVCSMNWDGSKCTRNKCDNCGWSFVEIERRKELPLVRLKNGLYAKIVGKSSYPEEVSEP